MNDRQIHCFLEAAKTLNFTKAAENLETTQQALSHHITTLEAELDTQLFVRKNTRNIFLSEEGKIYFNLMQRFATELEDTRNRINTAPQTIKFGYSSGWSLSFMIPQIIKACQEQMPGLEVQIKCLAVPELTEALFSHELDAILTVADYPEHYPELICEPITSIRRLLFYSELLASPEEINDPSDFYNEKFFILDDSFIRQITPQIESFFAPYHFTPRLQHMENLETILVNVENGLGVTMLDEWGTGILSAPMIHSVEMNSMVPIGFAWHRNSNQSGISIMKDAFCRFFEKQKA